MFAVHLLQYRECQMPITFMSPRLQQRPKLPETFGVGWPTQQPRVDRKLNGRVANLVENEALYNVGLVVRWMLEIGFTSALETIILAQCAFVNPLFYKWRPSSERSIHCVSPWFWQLTILKCCLCHRHTCNWIGRDAQCQRQGTHFPTPLTYISAVHLKCPRWYLCVPIPIVGARTGIASLKKCVPCVAVVSIGYHEQALTLQRRGCCGS